MNILCGDIGGTKTLVQLCQLDVKGTVTVLHQQRFGSNDFDSFNAIIDIFLQSCSNEAIESACFGVAGPVTYKDGVYTSKVTNLPWSISSEQLANQFSINTVSLLNDFEAVGYGIGALNESEVVTLQAGASVHGGHQLVVGAGTGLGVAIRLTHPHALILPTEGGHADFAPANEIQAKLKQYVDQQIGRCSIESIVSGPGLANIYKFICHKYAADTSSHATTHFNGDDPSASIAQAAFEGSDLNAVRALDLFVECYGSQVGNLTLTSLPRGGVYIAGGIAPKIIKHLQKGDFMRAFVDKSKMRDLLEQIPVHVVMNPEVGLLGSQIIAAQQAKSKL